MNEIDQKAVDELRTRVGELASHFTDFDFLRYLQGYDYKIEDLVPFIQKNCEILKAIDAENYQPSEVMRKYWSRGILGETGMNDDNLVVIETLGRDDCEGLVKSTTLFDIIWSIYVLRIKACMESIRKKEAETGRQWAMVHVIDLGGITFDSKFFNCVYGYLKLMASVYSEHSVEMNRKVVVVNVGNFVQHMFNMIKYLIPEKTRKKFLVLGSSWKYEVQRHIKPSHLPVHWGGTLVDHQTGDEFCSTLLTIAPGPVDSYYFRSPEQEIEFKSQIARSLDVPAWKSVNILVKVEKSNSKMIVKYMAQNDYGFGAYFVGGKVADGVDMIEKEYTYSKISLENAISIYPFFHRIPGPNRVVEEMYFACVRAGYYLVHFSNEFSWMSHLKIFYHITVE